MPTLALEALILGKPLIVNPQGGVEEILELAEEGCLFVKSSEDLRRAMKEFILKPATARGMGLLIQKRKDAIIKRFNHEALYQQYRDYYQELL